MNMTKKAVGFFLAVGILAASAGAFAEESSNDVGATKFKQLCAMCHPNGENTITPKKTLHAAVRESNGVKTADDIIKLMRNPGPRMTIYNEKIMPQKDAEAIADYVMRTFK